jgi:hypothetical protein
MSTTDSKLSFDEYAAQAKDDESFVKALGLFTKAHAEDQKAHAEDFGSHMNYTDDVHDDAEDAYFRPLAIMVGRKYLRLVTYNGTQHMVYCFIDRTTGNILKAATWKAPAKGARASIYKPQSYEVARCNKAGLAYGGWMYR